MFLKKLKIENFRGIKQAEIELSKGTTILIGENNTGKTTIIDAIRAALTNYSSPSYLRLNRHDFHRETLDDTGSAIEISISGEFEDLTHEDTRAMFDSIVAGSDGFTAQIGVSAKYDSKKERCYQKNSGGIDLSCDVGNTFEYIDVTYLKPLRDPDSLLKSGRTSYISRGVQRFLVDENTQNALTEIINNLNKQISENESIKKFSNLINEQTKDLLGKDWEQDLSIILDNTDFLSFISDLKLLIEKKEYFLNGLGLNNIIAIAMILAMHNEAEGYRMILIEEPEAHLHPILQRKLLEYINNTVKNKKNIQVVISSHSPNLVSAADISSICLVNKNIRDNSFKTTLVAPLFKDDATSQREKRKLERFLDATRADLFFNKRLILVEGIAETLLLPQLAKICGCDLLENGISVINCMGLNFSMFIPIIKAAGIRTFIVTDDDRPTESDQDDKISEYAKSLRDKVKDIPCIHLGLTPQTFEKALFNKPKLLEISRLAALELHPRSGDGIAEASKSGENLFQFLFAGNRADGTRSETKTSKGEFAQAFLNHLDKDQIELSSDDIPTHIVEGLKFLIL